MAESTAEAAEPKKAEAAWPEFLPTLPAAGIITSALQFLGDTSSLGFAAILAALRGQFAFSDFVEQMSVVGVNSLGIVLVITMATGAVFAFYTATMAMQMGFGQMVGGTLAYGYLNELGPVLGGVALAARAGAAIAAEIGTMVVTEQVDAMRAMAVSPLSYLVVPRVLAALVMLPLLVVVADFAGLISASLFALTRGVPQHQFWDSVHTFVGAPDFTNGLIKAVVFGLIVGVVACQQGLRTKGGASGVGLATTRSVVLCIVLIFSIDLLLTHMLTNPSLSH